ncbi:MAG: TonB family protein [Flavobacteriales bacterium]|nr:TonB family protein [Flavobacteriales bacterium]
MDSIVSTTDEGDRENVEAPPLPPQGEEVFGLLTVEEQPEFPGGQEAMARFVVKNTKYPPEMIDANVQGRVYMEFVVRKDGRITDVEVKRGVARQLDEEAERVEEHAELEAGHNERQARGVHHDLAGEVHAEVGDTLTIAVRLLAVASRLSFCGKLHPKAYLHSRSGRREASRQHRARAWFNGSPVESQRSHSPHPSCGSGHRSGSRGR